MYTYVYIHILTRYCLKIKAMFEMKSEYSRLLKLFTD